MAAQYIWQALNLKSRHWNWEKGVCATIFVRGCCMEIQQQAE